MTSPPAAVPIAPQTPNGEGPSQFGVVGQFPLGRRPGAVIIAGVSPLEVSISFVTNFTALSNITTWAPPG